MFILRSVAAIILALIIYLIAATVVGFALAWEYRDWGFLASIFGFIAALIGTGVGMAAAKFACDSLIKSYSGKAVSILFLILTIVFLGDLLLHKAQFQAFWIPQIGQAILSALLSVFLFWKNESAFSSAQTA
ncbi:MAG: hypothetical protein AB1508_12660 [Pseudomonadota bacterium]